MLFIAVWQVFCRSFLLGLSATDEFTEMMELYNIPMEEFGDLIDAQKHGITRAAQIYSDNMDKELKYVSDHLLSGPRFLTVFRNTRQLTENDMRFGYFAKMMRPKYTEALEITGKEPSSASIVSSILIGY